LFKNDTRSQIFLKHIFKFQKSPQELAEIARLLRTDVIKSLYLAKSGHSGGSLGLADIMTVLYFGGVWITIQKIGKIL